MKLLEHDVYNLKLKEKPCQIMGTCYFDLKGDHVTFCDKYWTTSISLRHENKVYIIYDLL